MINAVTGSVAIVGALLILLLKPRYAACVYFVLLINYPEYLSVAFGPLSFSVTRILVLILFIKIIFFTDLVSRFQILPLDYWVVLFAFAQFLSLLFNVPLFTVIERQGGQALDTVFPYLAVRLLVRTRQDFWLLVKAITIGAVPVALVGLYQCLAHTNPWYYLVGSQYDPILVRHGLYRADASFGNYIAYGMLFAFLAPLTLTFYGQNMLKNSVVYVLFAIMVVAALTSLSSGPLFTLFVALAMIGGFPFRHRWRMGVLLFVAFCVFLEFYSNRHFYEVITRFAFNSSTAYYRIGLYEEAFGGGMAGHWLFGYGYVGLGAGNDNTFFLWRHQDMTSAYIGYLARFGLVGLIPFLILMSVYYRRLYKASFIFLHPRDQWVIWVMASALVGWSVGTLSVGFVQQTTKLFNFFIALACNLPIILNNPNLLTAGEGETVVKAEVKRGEQRQFHPTGRGRRR